MMMIIAAMAVSSVMIPDPVAATKAAVFTLSLSIAWPECI
jgi:hypothetical protein